MDKIEHLTTQRQAALDELRAAKNPAVKAGLLRRLAELNSALATSD